MSSAVGSWGRRCSPGVSDDLQRRNRSRSRAEELSHALYLPRQLDLFDLVPQRAHSSPASRDRLRALRVDGRVGIGGKRGGGEAQAGGLRAARGERLGRRRGNVASPGS